MSDLAITVSELFGALLHRDPTEWEGEYWRNEMKHHTLESIIRRMTQTNEHLRFHRDNKFMAYPAGHFYSPIVDLDFIKERQTTLFNKNKKESIEFDLNESGQVNFSAIIAEVTKDLPFSEEARTNCRYYYNNGAFVYGDAVVYAAMLKYHRPKRIIEVGSGFSSALALDICDAETDYAPEFHFIEPYPKLLESLISEKDRERVRITPSFIQDVPLEVFDELESGDFYFMDTTHIVKTGSDVVHHFDNILPRLKSGVILHIHDIFFPFEYPKVWAIDARLSWNELYYFKAFMTGSNNYETLFFNSFMNYRYFDRMREASPIFAKHCGASYWFKKS